MKRLLSLLLTMCMLVSLLPAVSIAHAAEPSGVTVVYPMVSFAYTEGSQPTDIRYDNAASANRLNWHDNTTTVKDAPGNWGGNVLNLYFTSDEQYAAYRINVPASGAYDVSVKCGTIADGSMGEMYILPADSTPAQIVTAFTEQEPVLKADFGAATASGGTNIGYSQFYADWQGKTPSPAIPVATGVKVLDAGEYLVVWRGVGTKTSLNGARYHIRPATMTLNGGPAVVPMYSESLLSKSRLNIRLSDSAEISTSKVVKSDGTAGDSADIAALTYKSSNENVVKVDGKKITAVGTGVAKIYTMSGERIIEEDEITVVDEDLAWSGVTVTYPFESKHYPELAHAEEISYINSGCRVGFLDKTQLKLQDNLPWRRYALSFHIHKDKYYAYKINIPKEGYYNVDVGYQKGPAGTLASLYVLPGDTTDIVAAAAKTAPVMTVDFNGVELPAQEEAPFHAEALYEAKETGDHILVWLGTGNYNNMGRYCLWPRDITFNGGEKIVPMGVNFELSKSLRPTASLAMSDGTSIAGDKLGVKYSFSPEGIVTQNPATGKFEIPGRGDVTITASVEYEGKTYSSSVKRTITGNEILPYSVAYAKYDFSQKSPFWTPVYWQGSATPKSNDIRGITYEYTSNTGVGNWQWHESSIPNIYTQTGNTAVETFVATNIDGHMRVGISTGKWVAFKIKVPAAGRYLATANYRVTSSGRVAASMYVLPGDIEGIDNIEAALVDDNYIGRFNCLDANVLTAELRSAQYPDVDIPQEKLSADGEAVLVFKAVSGGYFDVKSVELDGTPGMKKVELSTDSDKIEVGSSEKLNVNAYLLDESLIDEADLKVKYTSKASNIAEISDTGWVTGVSEGTAEIIATVTYNGKKITASTVVTVEDTSEILSAEISVDKSISENAKKRIIFNGTTANGSVIEIPASEISYELNCDPDGIAYVDEEGYINAIGAGTVLLNASLKSNPQISDEAEITVVANEGKTEATLFTGDMRKNALENIKKYSWAKDLKTKAIENAEEYIQNLDFYYNHIIGQGIPRAIKMGTRDNPDYKYCNYCGVNIVDTYGNDGAYAYNISFMARPWKIQCPDCKRLFPSNDFGSFYELGLDEHGIFDIDLARENHHKMLFHEDGEECTCTAPTDQNTAEWHEYYGYGNPDGYLYNELYSEVRDSDTDPNPQKGGRYVNGDIWGVDDGFGYIPRDENWVQYVHSGGKKEMHDPIAYYNGYTWFQDIRNAIVRLKNAYLYTGDEKYGRAGAILLDRIADVYPEMDVFDYWIAGYWANTSTGDAAIFGLAQDVHIAENIAEGADAFLPALEDEFVIDYLSEKAKEHSLANKKESSYDIWENWEENILRENYRKTKTADIMSNFGSMQVVLAKSAVAIGNEADSEEILDFLYKSGEYLGYKSFTQTGGKVSKEIVDNTDRDGFGFESSPQYNYFTPDGLTMIADALSQYKGKNAEKYDIISNPRFAQIVSGTADLVLSDSHTIQLGDSQGMATLGFVDNTADLVLAFKYLKDTPVAEKLAKQIYFLEEGDFSELHYDIYTENPESVVDELEALVSHAEQPKSNLFSGFGLALLRDGERHDATSHTGANNSLRTFWLYGGWGSSSHHHRDTLSIGVEAFGLNLAPDNGYPESTGAQPNRVQWVEATLSHNTVTVDEEIQELTLEAGDPLHYDGDGRVKLVDMRSEEAYPELDEYRRTLVTVEAPGDIAYAVDFFNVKGGNSHIYSFHAQSESAQTEGLNMVPQMKDGEYSGSYAGVDVEGFKQDPGTPDSSLFYPKGFTWLKNLDRAANPEGTFVVDFAITDYNKAISNNKDIHLRMTQLPDTGADFTEVTVADGYVPNKQVNKNLPRGIKYALVKREGENLNSLFTTVLEPYRGERYIKSITPVAVTPAPSTGEVKAVCVELTNGQKDYIVYSTDSSVRYNVGGVFNFQGFVGVYSVDQNGNNVYSYINDGTVIGDNAGLLKEYTGTVAEFNKDYEYNNHITLNMQVEDAATLAGKTVRVENDGVQNGVYLIQSAEKLSDEQVKLNLGLVTTIRKYVDEDDFTKGYVYNIKEGQTATIALEHEEDYSPVFEALTSNPTVSAGSSLSIPIKAKTELDGVTISYVGTSLPRGASINENTGVLTWKPDASQVGDNHVSVTARDSSGRESVCHFVITVYGSTTGGSSNDTQTDENENSPSGDTPPAGGGGGGGGGGGAAPTDKPDVDDESLLLEEKVPSEGEADEVEKPQFTDLGNHSWAEDAINALAADGIIKGTTASTFSPAANITRADFALLLVRAFKLTSDNAENFADVSASDYFAPELAVARNTGIVNGIGDNKFAPRNHITRQDMMVIVYRALQSLPFEEKLSVELTDEVLSQYPDFDTLADYAKEAVSALISAGLVNGKSGLVAPTDYTTRAEVAVLIKRILDYVK